MSGLGAPRQSTDVVAGPDVVTGADVVTGPHVVAGPDVVAGDAVRDRRPRQPLHEFYENPEVPASSGPDRARRMADLLSAVLRGSGAPALVVDVGCGDGAATSLAARRNPGHRMVGLDWSAGSLRHARRLGLTLVQGGVEPPGLPLAARTADVVIMSELIEHLIDTDSALDEASRVLKPGGSLLLSTPNLAAWYNRGLVALGVQPVFSEVSLRGVYGRPGSQVAGHLHLFTRRALVQLLAARGFDCVRVRGACYHDVPVPMRPLDRAFCWWPSAASILLVHARKR
jgi:SAM-dependent methyltransferase